jgi:hypothetical protein
VLQSVEEVATVDEVVVYFLACSGVQQPGHSTAIVVEQFNPHVKQNLKQARI